MYRRLFITIALSSLFLISYAQTTDDYTSETEHKSFIKQHSDVELFAGLDFNYRDVMLATPYEFLINVMPGIKWHPWKHTLVAAQAIVPIVNDYGSYYKKPRLNLLAVSHEMKLLNKLAIKPSAGLFTQERWGLDLKALYPVSKYFAVETQIGYTGLFSMAKEFRMSKINRLFATAGADVFIPQKNLQFRLIGGQFLNTDKGFYFEGMRHFRLATVCAYFQYSDKGMRANGYNGGFKVIAVIPSYHKRCGRVTFRPASNFRLTYNMNSDPFCNKVYNTDPEQNERDFWFSPDIFSR